MKVTVMDVCWLPVTVNSPQASGIPSFFSVLLISNADYSWLLTAEN